MATIFFTNLRTKLKIVLYKINFDGALFKVENQVGIGVVIRDSKEQVMVSLAQRIPLPSTAIEVEALAARRAMELALEMVSIRGCWRVIH